MSAAARRADYLRALQEERAGYERTGRQDRVEQVDDEIARVTGAPIGRSEKKPPEKPRTTTRARKS